MIGWIDWIGWLASVLDPTALLTSGGISLAFGGGGRIAPPPPPPPPPPEPPPPRIPRSQAEDIVTGAFQRFLRRDPDAQGLTAFASKLIETGSQAQIEEEIANSEEARLVRSGAIQRDDPRAPKAPPPPPAPPAPPSPPTSQAVKNDARADERKRQRQRTGRRSTILTSGFLAESDSGGAPAVGGTTLLGGGRSV